MIDANGKITCDKEVGRPGKGWHSCGKPAIIECRNERYGTMLHFCERHELAALEPGRKIVKTWIVVSIPGDEFDSNKEIADQAVLEAREELQTHTTPATWTAEIISGEVGDFKVKVRVTRYS